MNNSTVFEASYFDGRTTHPHAAEVTLSPDGINISYRTEPDQEITRITWEYHKVHRNELNNRKIVLKYGDFPFETIELDSDSFLGLAYKFAPQAPFLHLPYQGYFRIGTTGIVIGVASIIGLLFAFYFFIIPSFMNFAAARFPRSIEYRMGQSLKSSFLGSMEIDKERTANINRFFSQLRTEGSYKINITVVKSKVKNAFALPGGEIVVYSAIIDTMETYEELVALLGHELGHVEERHTLKLLFRNLSNYIIISALLQDVSGIMAIIIDNAASLNSLSYTRKAESESDKYGFDLMKRNRINPEGMPSLFEKLKHGQKDATQLPEFLATHPSLDKRIQTVGEWISEQPFSSAKDPDLEHYWKLLKKR